MKEAQVWQAVLDKVGYGLSNNRTSSRNARGGSLLLFCKKNKRRLVDHIGWVLVFPPLSMTGSLMFARGPGFGVEIIA